MNLANVDYQELGRGIALVFNEQWHRTRKFDAAIRILPTLTHDVSRRGAYSLYVGSGEWPVKIRVLGPDRLTPGSDGHVRIFLPESLPLLPGDRFVLREAGRDETIGGGHVLDVDPVLKASEAQPDLSIERVVSEREWITVDELERLTGVRTDPVLGNWVTSEAVLAALKQEVQSLVEEAGPLGLDVALLDERQRLAINNLQEVEVSDGRVKSVDQEDILANHPILAELEKDLFSPNQPGHSSKEELRGLLQRGLVIQNQGVFFATSAIDQASIVVAHLLQDKPEGVTVAEIRDALNTTRKFALPICAVLDKTGVTRRRDDLRIGGPRLPKI